MRRKKHYPREMKIDPKFQPCEILEGQEYYPNGIFVFNISRMLEDIASGKLPVKLERINVEKWHSDYSRINEEHMPNVKLGAPVIIAEISAGRFNVIDGHHRIEKASREGLENIEAYKVFGEQLPRYITTIESYKSYVNYWNGKLEDML